MAFPKITLVSVNLSKYPCPPLGLASIATYLIKEGMASYQSIQILDLSIEKNLMPQIKKYQPDIVGISSMTPFYPLAIRLAQKIKKHSKKTKVAIGGVHISTAPQSLSGVFDVGVIGEGERTFYELINHFKEDRSLKKAKLKTIPGLVFLEGRKIIQSRPREAIVPLDALPWPDWKLFSSYLPYYLKGVKSKKNGPCRTGYIITSRGCPYRCLFCSSSRFWKRVRLHTPKYVAEEIEYLVKEFSVDQIIIEDDVFNLSKKRVRAVISELQKRSILGKVKFKILTRADSIDEESCLLFKKLGVRDAFIGFESGSERILRYLKNNTVTVKDNKNTARLLNKYGIKMHGGIIFGSPGEKIDDMRKSLQFMKWFSRLKCAVRLSPYVLTPFPETEVWETALKKGLVSNRMKNWQTLNISSSKLFFSEKINQESFDKIYKKAEAISHKITLSEIIRLKTEKDKKP